jgi:hypothetical protein
VETSLTAKNIRGKDSTVKTHQVVEVLYMRIKQTKQSQEMPVNQECVPPQINRLMRRGDLLRPQNLLGRRIYTQLATLRLPLQSRVRAHFLQLPGVRKASNSVTQQRARATHRTIHPFMCKYLFLSTLLPSLILP